MSKALSIVGQAESGLEQSSTCCKTGITTADDTTVSSRKFRGRVAVVTLGCAKNQVDSELMLGALVGAGFEIVSDLKTADIAVVNTCGFLQSAAEESIDAILDLAEYKKEGRLRKLIVAGCLVERYRADLRESLPEVDSFITTHDLLRIGEVAGGEVQDLFRDGERPYFIYDETTPRFLQSKAGSAYVKIAEGCNRPCTFCIIPQIRGKMRSRSIESIATEIKTLAQHGVREAVLVAQDLTAFGKDRSERLVDLLYKLDQDKAVPWIRLLYSYPIGIDRELVQAIASLPTVCEYLDLPLQHSSEKVLKAMQRPIGRFAPRPLIAFIREHAPNVHLRTTFIVGFPGETEEDVADLEQFILEGHFTNVGIFCYSPEEGTPSFNLPGQIEREIMEERRSRLMQAQQQVAFARAESQIGKTLEVLIEGPHPESDLLFAGRTRFQAPEVDGQVIINDVPPEAAPLVAGAIVQVEITDTAGYDLIGRVL